MTPSTQPLSKNLLLILVWLALAGGLFYFMYTQLNPNRASQLGNGAEVVLQRDLNGHYRAEAVINGVTIPVMVDTGATDVAISQALADRLGLRGMDAVRVST